MILSSRSCPGLTAEERKHVIGNVSPLVLRQYYKSYWQLAWCYSPRSVGKLWNPEGGKLTTNLIHLSQIMLKDNVMNIIPYICHFFYTGKIFGE